MSKRLTMTVLAGLLLSGCASSGGVAWTAGNSPSECANQIVQGKVPVSEQHGYVEKCSAGYRAAHDDDDGSIKFDPVHKDGQGQ
ncbi:MAG TPA: hypothetical protein VFJ01_02385 [Oleiagrimonas sp.]|nr:hypothetical protein [Oleiagrimonas sp.]